MVFLPPPSLSFFIKPARFCAPTHRPPAKPPQKGGNVGGAFFADKAVSVSQMLVAEDMELWERFRSIGVSVEDFCIPWFSSIFMASFPTSHRNQMLDRCIAYARLFGFVVVCSHGVDNHSRFPVG